MNSFRRHRAFTLIELLVVIGLIALIAGGLGLALGRGDGGMAMQNGQAILASTLSNVKSVAALNQANAGLYLNVDPDSDGFLRELRIAFVPTTDINGNAIPIVNTFRIQRGDPTFLPRGVFVVPSDGSLGSDVSFTGTWTDRKSTLHIATSVPIKLPDRSTDLPGTFHLLMDFNSRGIPQLPGNRIVLAPALAEAGQDLVFDRPDAVRAIIVSRYGLVSPVNDSSSL